MPGKEQDRAGQEGEGSDHAHLCKGLKISGFHSEIEQQ